MTTNPNQHERIRADLKAFADGELSPLARFFVARHLRDCPSCREELTQMQTLSTELRESEPESAPLPSDLRAQILENAPTEETTFDEEAAKRSRRVARKKMVLALGVTAILAAVLFPVFQPARENARKAASTGSADFMSSTSPSGVASSHNPSVVVGGAPFSSTAGSAPAIPAPPANDFKTQNGLDSNGLFADGHVKTRNEDSRQSMLRSIDRLDQQRQANESTDFSVSLAAPSAANPINAGSVVPQTRAVHREGSLGVSVQNAEEAGDSATAIIKNAGGFVANTSLETGANQRRTAVLDCRVPVAQFETVVKKIGALGTVRSKSLSGQDITAQVASSGARRQALSNELSIAQARLAKLENSRKPNTYDLYRVRSEVRTIRIQAAQARAALETLQKYGSLSSLYVSLQDGNASATATPKAAGWFDSLSPSTQSAWNSFLSNARLPLQLLMWVLAYSPIWLPALIVWHKYGRKWLTQ